MGGLATQNERIEERYYDGIRDSSSTRQESLDRRIRVECDHCEFEALMPDPAAASLSLRQHLTIHPVASPRLIVAGRQVVGTLRVSRRMTLGAVQVLDAERVEAAVGTGGFKEVTPQVLDRLFLGTNDAVVSVRLTNGILDHGRSIAREFRVVMSVPDPEVLHAIDQAFLLWLANDSPSRDALLGFSDETDGLEGAYRDGLYGYIAGVLGKGGGETVEPPRWKSVLDCFRRSASLLNDFDDRPVAAIVAACSRLNLNDFRRRSLSTGSPELDEFIGLMSALSSAYSDEDHGPWPSRPPLPANAFICPVDGSTRFLIDTALSESMTDIVRDDALDRLDDGSLSPPDRAKLAAIVGERAYRQGDVRALGQAVTAIGYDRTFRPLVQRWEA